MSLALELSDRLYVVTDIMTESKSEPIATLGHLLSHTTGWAVDLLDLVEQAIPLEVQTRSRAKANMCAAFELGRDSVLERRGEPGGYRLAPPRRRHLHAL